MAMAMGQAWVPRMVQLYSSSADAPRSLTATAVSVALAGCGTAAMMAGALAPAIIVVVGGPSYLPGARALPLLAARAGAALSGVAQFAGTGLTLQKRTGLYSIAMVLAAAVCFLLQLLLIPRWDMLGAALSVAAEYSTLLLTVLLTTRFVFPLPLAWARFGAGLAAPAVQASVCTARPDALAVAVATAVNLAVLLAATPWPRRAVGDSAGAGR